MADHDEAERLAYLRRRAADYRLIEYGPPRAERDPREVAEADGAERHLPAHGSPRAQEFARKLRRH